MSFLVLIITDLIQKEMVNRLRRTHPSRDKYGLVHYAKVADECKDSKGVDSNGGDSKGSERGEDSKGADDCLELPDDMPIAEAYFRHVERYIYSHPSARKMLSLDGDPVRVFRPHRVAAVRPPQ